MATAGLPCLPEIEITHPAEILKSNRVRVEAHLDDQLLNTRHVQDDITINTSVKIGKQAQDKHGTDTHGQVETQIDNLRTRLLDVQNDVANLKPSVTRKIDGIAEDIEQLRNTAPSL